MNRIVIGTLAGVGIAGMATAPAAYAAQLSTEVTTRAPAQSSEHIVVAEAGMGGMGLGCVSNLGAPRLSRDRSRAVHHHVPEPPAFTGAVAAETA